ncbi:transcriptional regulator, AraC family [Thioalkalivibrio nitratireducens DSM 14787]|uniref:Transcriptional regulator, AraC family n=1 Tax=Thioalkalivibrio nitratireducens (strain DSM 14787 / UNIQEM 213 / ALEN2) TaxID=1255043 RepID=L0DZ28_THIND|nr:hypothetical protein [Thioalkalivibrio nitratireducens]AGA34303.1 transcriptional regulator, AraC family [Thioalkalivibrio nitratireducens DSM 14787]
MFERTDLSGDRTAPQQLIRNRDLLAMSNDIGPDYRIVAPRPTPEQPALRGRVSHVRMRPGLYLHSTDVLDLRTMAVQVSLARQLNVVLVLNGEIDVSFDARQLRLAAAQARRGRGAEGALIAMPEQTLFSRTFHEGRRERKISISVDLAWLADSGLEPFHATGSLLDAFADGRLAIARWRPSAKAIALAEQIHNPPPYAPPLRNLYLESRAIDILTEALLPATGVAPRAREAAAAEGSVADAGVAGLPRPEP